MHTNSTEARLITDTNNDYVRLQNYELKKDNSRVETKDFFEDALMQFYHVLFLLVPES